MASVCADNEEGVDVSGHIKRAGPFLLGPKLGNSPVKSMIHCLARKEGTNKFFIVKVLTLKNSLNTESIEDQQGKILLHTEYSLLTLLKGQKGVVQHHGLFKDTAAEEVEINGKVVKTGNQITRLCLVLDCYTPHDFCPSYAKFANLQYYVLKEKKLEETEAITIFYNIVQIVERLHEQNIVHRDLKLGNITLDKQTKQVTLGNFCLGKQLTTEDQVLIDQRGSPAYISPDVICGKPYLGKPSDIWALGVILYTMLYGQFPFFDQTPSELFRKIKAAEFSIPMDPYVSIPCIELIKSLLVLNPKERLTCSQVLRALENIMAARNVRNCDTDLQQVPSKRPHDDSTEEPVRPKRVWSQPSLADIENLLASATSRDEEKSHDPEEIKEDVAIHEPPRKIAKVSARLGLGSNSIKLLRVKDEARVLTVGDLQKLYAVYVANKAKQQAAAPTPITTTGAGVSPAANAVAAAAAAAAPRPALIGTPSGQNNSSLNAVNSASNAETLRTFNSAERVLRPVAAAFKSPTVYSTSAKAML